jgi:DNA-binding response OmpR family regulator
LKIFAIYQPFFRIFSREGGFGAVFSGGREGSGKVLDPEIGVENCSLSCQWAGALQELVMRVLVVEDDRKTAGFISKALKTEGCAVDVLHDGDEAFLSMMGTAFDVVVLDIMLKGRDGLSVLRQARMKGNHTPVILLSARGEVNERVEGLKAGADDYLSKPFALEELVARVETLFRRGTDSRSGLIHVADLTLDTAMRKAQRGGRTIELTSREYRLLEYLMRSPGRICTRMMIFEKVWDYHFDPGSNIIDVYIRKLREKIDEGFATKLLHSVRGVGYMLKEEE